MCTNCRRLRERIHALEGELGLRANATRLSVIRQRFGLSTVPARIVMMLWAANGRVIHTMDIGTQVCGEDTDIMSNVKVHISKIRRRSPDLQIFHEHGGYRLGAESLILLNQEVTDLVQPPLSVPDDVKDMIPDNDDPAALATAFAVIAGRMAHEKGADYARSILKNVGAAVDRLYGPERVA